MLGVKSYNLCPGNVIAGATMCKYAGLSANTCVCGSRCVVDELCWHLQCWQMCVNV